MKKVKIILTLIALSLIIVISGCNGKTKTKTAPWSKKDVQRMNNEGQEKVPLIRWEF